jgi:hypothetical protein
VSPAGRLSAASSKQARSAIPAVTSINGLPSESKPTRRSANVVVTPDDRMPVGAIELERGGHRPGDTQPAVAPSPDTLPELDVDRICRQLVELHKQRNAAMRTRIGLMHPFGALARQLVAQTIPDSDAKGDAVRDRGKAIVTAITKNKLTGLNESERMIAIVMRPVADRFIEAEKIFRAWQNELDRKILKLVVQLPVWSRFKVRGFGPPSLALIVGEAGDLSNYANPAKLWKRFGLHVYKGKAASTWKRCGGITAEEFLQLGYVGTRNSVMYTIGGNLIRAKNPEYAKVYNDRKAYEKARDPKCRAHMRALRFMRKRLLRELWRAWRDLPTNPLQAEHPAGSELEAKLRHARAVDAPAQGRAA